VTRPPARWADGLARAATEALAPAAVVALLLVGTAFVGAPSPVAAARWAGVALVGAVLLPAGFVLVGVHAGRYGSHHIPDRRRRLVPFVVWALLALTVQRLLRADGATAALLLALGAVAATLLAAALANLVWKLSLHAAMAACAVATAVLAVGPAALALAPLVALVAWARVRLGAHDPAQVAAGLALGAAAAALAARLTV